MVNTTSRGILPTNQRLINMGMLSVSAALVAEVLAARECGVNGIRHDVLVARTGVTDNWLRRAGKRLRSIGALATARTGKWFVMLPTPSLLNGELRCDILVDITPIPATGGLCENLGRAVVENALLSALSQLELREFVGLVNLDDARKFYAGLQAVSNDADQRTLYLNRAAISVTDNAAVEKAMRKPAYDIVSAVRTRLGVLNGVRRSVFDHDGVKDDSANELYAGPAFINNLDRRPIARPVKTRGSHDHQE